jgi:hypothetical protein
LANGPTPAVPVCDLCGEDAVMTGMRGKQPVALCALHLPQFDTELASLYATIMDIKLAIRRRREGRTR